VGYASVWERVENRHIDIAADKEQHAAARKKGVDTRLRGVERRYRNADYQNGVRDAYRDDERQMPVGAKQPRKQQ